MNEPMWFVLGMLCGALVCGAVLLCLPRERHSTPAQKVRRRKHVSAEWGRTRNFLYYDGTEMPVIKERKHEQ